jgi:hypothetical protein
VSEREGGRGGGREGGEIRREREREKDCGSVRMKDMLNVAIRNSESRIEIHKKVTKRKNPAL